MVYKKQDELEKLKKDNEMLSVQEAQAEGPTMEIKITKQTLEEEKDSATKEIDCEWMNKLAYQHMLDRLKKDFTSSKI